MLGRRFLLLTHVGRRTRRVHHAVLEVMLYDDARREAVVMSGFGPRSDWLLNVQHGGPASVTIGREHFEVKHRLLDEDCAVQVLRDYERRNRPVRPFIRYVLGRLLGWRYRGTDDQRRRAVRELPLVSLSPVDEGAP
jgi:deazaflavin-dependent oxidoreductase (nitroreductase family)